MLIYVNVSPADAVKGDGRAGLRQVDVDLERLTDEQRELLARNVREEANRVIFSEWSKSPHNVESASHDGVVAWLNAKLEKAAADKAKRIAESTKKLEEFIATPVENRLRFYVSSDVWDDLPTPLVEDYKEARAEAQAYKEARAEAQEEAERRADERKAKREAEREAERTEWIESNGSARLKRCVEEGIEHDAIYFDERLAADCPGWQWEDYDVFETYTDPRNPRAEAFDLLDEARKTFADAELKFVRAYLVQDDEDADCYEPRPQWSGLIVVADVEWARGKTANLMPDDCPLKS